VRKTGNIDRDRLIIRILSETGLTLRELVLLKVSDVRLPDLILRRSKHPRTVRLSPQLQCMLKDHISGIDAGYLFSRRKMPLSSRRIEQIVSEHSLAEGRRLSPRIIRNRFLKERMCSPGQSVDLDLIRRLEFASERDETLLLILSETACTLSEIIAIRVSDLKGCTIQMNGRIVPITSYLSSMLRELSRDFRTTDYLLSGRKPLSARRVQQIVGGYRVFGDRLTASKIRKSRIVELSSQGVPIVEIRRRTGLLHCNRFTHGIMEVS
jgi:integrase